MARLSDRAQAIATLSAAKRRAAEVLMHLERALEYVQREELTDEDAPRLETQLCFAHDTTSAVKQGITRTFNYIERWRKGAAA